MGIFRQLSSTPRIPQWPRQDDDDSRRHATNRRIDIVRLMISDANTALPRADLPLWRSLPRTAQTGVRPRLQAGRTRQRAALAAAPGSHRKSLIAAVGAFLVGISTTLYVTILETEGVTLRPVQLIPLILLPLALSVPRTRAFLTQRPLYGLAILWTLYTASRFLLLPPTDPLTAVRSIACAAAFLSVMGLSVRLNRPHAVLIGLVAGCLASVACAATDFAFLGKAPRYYGSSRWTGMMPDPNRFADLCGIAFVICLAMTIRPTTRLARFFWRSAWASAAADYSPADHEGGCSLQLLQVWQPCG